MGKEKKKKRKRSRSTSISSSSSDEERKIRKVKKKLKKEKRRAEKMLKKQLKAEKKKAQKLKQEKTESPSEDTPADIPVDLMEKPKFMAPMTKEEWDKRQSVVRKVYDEDSGRYRLIKGDGEIIESIVSRDEHKKINQRATQADGTYFQANTVHKKRKSK